MNNILKNVFTKEEIDKIESSINNPKNSKFVDMPNQVQFDPQPLVKYSYLNQGRSDTYEIEFDNSIIDKITKIANSFIEDSSLAVSLTSIQYTEYSGDMDGNPSLGIHFDGGSHCDMILDYQLESNISWGLGVDEEVYTLSDNELLLLNPVTKIHYRPIKKFNPGDFMRMIFFKFSSEGSNFISPEISKDKMERIQSIYNNYYLMEE
jgi:hypothetical protein